MTKSQLRKIEKYAKIRKEFEKANEDVRNALIFKYGDKNDETIQSICREYMKYDIKTASDYISRDPDAVYSIRN